MDFAAAVNEEAHDLQAAGADVIQLDEPWLRNDPEAAKRFAVQGDQPRARGPHGADRRAPVLRLRGAWCRARPSRPATRSCRSLPTPRPQQISIEAAQPKLDLGVLKDLAGKKIMLGVIDLDDPTVETPQVVAERIRAGAEVRAAERLIPAPDCGMKYLPREVAFGKLKALSEGAAIVRRELS